MPPPNRDIVKKKRDEQLKMVWRVSPAHKKLQTRMEQMRKFRRQHEQLRTVIVRVLRPTVVKTTTLADGDTADLKPEMDAADLNAIEEVCWKSLCIFYFICFLGSFCVIFWVSEGLKFRSNSIVLFGLVKMEMWNGGIYLVIPFCYWAISVKNLWAREG